MYLCPSSVLALELRQNKAKYERTAREMTAMYASNDRQELKRVCQAVSSIICHLAQSASAHNYNIT